MKLTIGDTAPNFRVKDQNGEEHTLAMYKGKKVLLYFYPKDNTPGCNAQACNIRDNYAAITAAGIVVLGVSMDSEAKHKKFENKFQLPFTLLADEDKKLIDAYGVWGEKSFMGKTFMGIHRTSFLIDEAGKIAHIIEKVKTKEHTAQVMDFWR